MSVSHFQILYLYICYHMQIRRLGFGGPGTPMDRSPRLLGVRRSYANQKSGPICAQTPANSFGIDCITKEQSKISYLSFFGTSRYEFTKAESFALNPHNFGS